MKPKAAVRTTLTDSEIKRMAEYVYANALAWDERPRYLPNPSSGRHWALRPDAMSYFGGRSKFKVKAAVWLT